MSSGVKRFAAYAALGLVLYLGFLVATVPAAWVAQGAARLSDRALLLARPRGTLWRGAGELHAGRAAGGARAIGTLQWRLKPWRLLLGAAELDVALAGPEVRARGILRFGHDHLAARDLSATAPAALASLVYGPVAFFDPLGTITLRAPSLELSAEGLRTDAELRWEDAGGRFTGAKTLGDYRLQLRGQGEHAQLTLTTLAGDLELAGQGQWQVTGSGAIRFAGSATPRNGAGAELEPLLRALGPDRGNGRRDIRLDARLPLVRMLGF
jgi:hypothetical protein